MLLLFAFLDFIQLSPFADIYIYISGKDFAKVVQSTLSENIPPFRAKSGGDLEEKYKSFLLSKFPDLPEEFSF